MTEVITVEIVPAELGLELTAKNTVELAFRGFFNQAEEWKAKAAAITDPKEARIARLEMKNLRVSVEKKHKEIKADALLFGRAVDGAKNIFLSIAKPIEDSLEDIEKAAEREAAAALEAIRIARAEQLAAISHETLGIDLAGLTQAQWEAYLIQATDAAIARKQREEQARIEAEAKAAAEAAEREAARLENIRLKEEAAKREAEIQAERAAAAKAAAEAEAKAAKERAAAKAKADKEREEANAKIMAAAAEKAKLEAEAKALRDAAAKRIAEEQAAAAAKVKAEALAAKKAAAAPDKEKLIAFAGSLAELKVPGMKSNDAQTIKLELDDRLNALEEWLKAQIATL